MEKRPGAHLSTWVFSGAIVLVPSPGLAALPGRLSLDHTGQRDSPNWQIGSSVQILFVYFSVIFLKCQCFHSSCCINSSLCIWRDKGARTLVSGSHISLQPFETLSGFYFKNLPGGHLRTLP